MNYLSHLINKLNCFIKLLKYLNILLISNINNMDNENLFCVDAKNIVKISNGYLEDISTINIDDNITTKTNNIKKVRTNYKHDVGSAQFYKDTNYGVNYYNTKKIN